MGTAMIRRTRISGQEKDKMISMYKEGRSVKDISKEVNRPVDTIYKILRDNDVDLRSTSVGKTGHRLTAKEKASLVIDYRHGMKIKDICKKYNICPRSVYININENDDERYVRYKLNPLQKILVLSDYTKGRRIKDICEEYDICPRYLYLLISKNNVTLRRTPGVPKSKPEIKGIAYYGQHGKKDVKIFNTDYERQIYAIQRLYEAVMEIPEEMAIEA